MQEIAAIYDSGIFMHIAGQQYSQPHHDDNPYPLLVDDRGHGS